MTTVIKYIAVCLLLCLVSACSPAAKKAGIVKRADRYFKAGEYDRAKIEYMNLVRLDPTNVTGFQQLGSIWSEQGVPLRAIPFLIRVRELAPQNVAARVKLALVFESINWLAQAREEAAAILERDPSNSEALTVLADTSVSKDDIEAVERLFLKFPAGNTARFHLAKAVLAWRKEDIGAAADELHQAITLDPNLARAHLVLANLYELRGNPSKAGPEFKTAAELSPLRSNERIKYAEFQVATGAVAEAKTSLQEITQKVPDFIPAWIALAKIRLTEKKYDESLSLLENVFSRDPDNLEGGLLESDVRLEKGEKDKAIAILEHLNSSYPDTPSIKYQVGRAYMLDKNLAQATVALQQAVALKPDYPDAILLLGEVNLRAGKPQAVVTAMEELRKKRPDFPQARVFLAAAYEALGRLDDAAALFREQVEIAPKSGGDHFLLGLVLRDQKKIAEARAEFEKALEEAPDNWQAIDQIVDLDLLEKRYDAAAQRVQQYLQKKPDAAAGHFMEGKILAAQRDWPHAESELQKAIDLDSNFGPAYGGLVSLYVVQKKLDPAVAQLQSSLKKNPGDLRGLSILGLIYARMKDYSSAADAYEKILTLSPDSVVALNNLAYLYSERLNRLDRAYELAQKARSIQPGDGSVADSLGWVLYKRGEYQRALPLLQESVGKLPTRPEIQFHLGMTAYMMGQIDVARAALEKAAHAASDFPGKDEAQRRLASLEGSFNQTAQQQQLAGDLLALTRLGESYEKKGDPAEAVLAYEQALKLNPKLPDVPLKLARLYAGPLHNPDKAMAFARKARDLAPNDAEVAATLGRIAFQAGNYTWAYSLLNESVRQGNSDPAVLHDFAMATYSSGRVTEARQTMQRIVTEQPPTAQTEGAKEFLAMTTLEQPSAEAVPAQAEVDKILKAQPDNAPALMALAAIQLQRNDPSAAAATYSQVLQKYPDFAPAQKRLAGIYADNPDKLTKAYELAMKARKTLPEDTELARTLAGLSFQRKEFSYTIQLLLQAAAKRPLSSKELYYLGMAQLQTRQETRGRETLQRALASGLQDPFAQEAKKRLAEQ